MVFTFSRLPTIAVALLFCPFLLFGQAEAGFSLEEILSAPFPTELTAAPAGDRVAWVFNREGVRNIWVSDGPDSEARMITTFESDDGQDINQLTFSPDGEWIVFVRGGAPNRSGEVPNPRSTPSAPTRDLWAVSAGGETLRKLAEGSNPVFLPEGEYLTFLKQGQVWRIAWRDSEAEESQLFQIRGSASSPRWSPDGRRLAFLSNRGDHAFLGVYHVEEERIEYLHPSVDQDESPVWSPDGERLAWIRLPNERQRLPFEPHREGLPWSILVADLEAGSVDTAWTSPPGPGSAFRSISADRQLFWGEGDQLVFPYEGYGWTHLWAVSADGGKARCLTPGDFEVQFVTMAPDGSAMVYSSNQDDIDRQHIWAVGLEDNAPLLLTPGEGVEWSPVLSRRSGHVAMLASSAVLPAQPFWLTADEGRREPIAPNALPDNWPAEELTAPEQVIFRAADGLPIHGQLFKPADYEEGKKYPAVLFFHGGSRRQMLLGFHHRGYYHNAYALNQYLAQQGYIVLAVNYRSGIGYGLEFREALDYGAAGASEFNDVLGAGLYLQGREDVDPERIGLWGGSYGGYLTALGLARASDLFAAGVDIHGVHDWNVVIRNFVPSFQPEQRAAFARTAFESSPMAHLDGWRSPVLLIHGDDDRNVPFSETVDLVEQLRKRGVYFEQLVFPDEVHGFLLHQNWLAAYRATVDFFGRTLGKRE